MGRDPRSAESINMETLMVHTRTLEQLLRRIEALENKLAEHRHPFGNNTYFDGTPTHRNPLGDRKSCRVDDLTEKPEFPGDEREK